MSKEQLYKVGRRLNYAIIAGVVLVGCWAVWSYFTNDEINLRSAALAMGKNGDVRSSTFMYPAGNNRQIGSRFQVAIKAVGMTKTFHVVAEATNLGEEAAGAGFQTIFSGNMQLVAGSVRLNGAPAEDFVVDEDARLDMGTDGGARRGGGTDGGARRDNEAGGFVAGNSKYFQQFEIVNVGELGRSESARLEYDVKIGAGPEVAEVRNGAVIGGTVAFSKGECAISSKILTMVAVGAVVIVIAGVAVLFLALFAVEAYYYVRRKIGA